MIQCIDGTVMIKGSYIELTTDLVAIIVGLSTKFPKEAIISAVALGITESESDDLDEKMEVVMDKVFHKRKSDTKESEEKSRSDVETLKKMFGDLFNEGD